MVLLLLCARHAAPGLHSEVRCMSCSRSTQAAYSPLCSMRHAISRKPQAVLKDSLLDTGNAEPAVTGVCFTRIVLAACTGMPTW